MNEQPGIASIGNMIGDPARAAMLTALMSGQAMTATELANEAGITRQTASAHLGKLMDGGLLRMLRQGRHRYFSLASGQVGAMLESMMSVAVQTRRSGFRPGPRDPALRTARVCYDHRAGPYSVAIYEAFVRRGFLVLVQPENDQNGSLTLTDAGQAFCAESGIVLDYPSSRHAHCRPCLDWSERRFHIAGKLGVALLSFMCDKRWATRDRHSRLVHFSEAGITHLQRLFECEV